MWAQGPDGGEVKWSWTDSVSADSCCPQADTVADDQPTDVLMTSLTCRNFWNYDSQAPAPGFQFIILESALLSR